MRAIRYNILSNSSKTRIELTVIRLRHIPSFGMHLFDFNPFFKNEIDIAIITFTRGIIRVSVLPNPKRPLIIHINASYHRRITCCSTE